MRILLTVLNLALIGGAGYVAWSRLHLRMDGWLLWGMVLFAGIGVALLAGSAASVVRGAWMARVLSRSLDGSWADGHRTVVHGTVVSDVEPQEAPISGVPAVAFEYRVFRRVTTRSRSSSGDTELRHHTETAAFGFGQRRFSVRTSRGDVAVSGVAQLEHVPETMEDGPGALSRARALLSGAEVVTEASSPLSMLTSLVRVLGAETTDVEKHWRKADAPTDPTGWQLAERRIEVGDEVCVAGTWDASRGCLRPSGGETLEIVRGGRDEARRRWVAGSWVSAVLGLLFGLAFLAMVSLFWWTSGQAAPEAFPGQVSDGDLGAIQRQLEAGVDPNLTTALGSPMISTTSDPEVIELLLAGGADPDARDTNGATRLYVAALRGEAEVARVMLEGGADPDLEGPGGETPVLAAARGGRWELFDQLREAGADNPLVGPATGRALSPSEEPCRVVSRFMEAVRQRDRASLERLVGPSRRHDADLDAWARGLPPSPNLLQGFADDERATLEVSGPSGDGLVRRWALLLERNDTEGWRVTTYWSLGPEGLRWT